MRGTAKIFKAIQRKRGDHAALLLRAHVQTRLTKVRKITLASSAPGAPDGWQCGSNPHPPGFALTFASFQVVRIST